MANYQRARDTATKAIKKDGRVLSLIYIAETGPDYNPVQTPVPNNVYAVVTGYGSAEIDGTLIKSGDKKMIIAASEIEPIVTLGGDLEAMTIEDGGKNYSVIDVDELKPGPTAILYKLQCRV